jgi:transcriptional regulator with XRE-family HTH domain
MRCFKNIAHLIRTKRMSHPKGYSQSELSHLLGYKNGQFISNVERALCNIPLKMLKRVSEVLEIPPHELKDAILKDQEETIDNYLRSGEGEVNSPNKNNTTEYNNSMGSGTEMATGTDGIPATPHSTWK